MEVPGANPKPTVQMQLVLIHEIGESKHHDLTGDPVRGRLSQIAGIPPLVRLAPDYPEQHGLSLKDTLLKVLQRLLFVSHTHTVVVVA